MVSVEASAVKELGYDQLKELQMKVIKPFVAGKLQYFQQAMEKACAMPACQHCMTTSKTSPASQTRALREGLVSNNVT